MKNVYDLKLVLIASLIVACSASFAQLQNSKNGSGVIPSIDASNPKPPTKVSNLYETYTFAASSGTFTSIDSSASVMSTSATAAFGDDASQINIPIGFSFNFYGKSYTQVAVCTNGFMSFVLNPNTSDNPNNGNLGTPGPTLHSILPFAAPLFGDLQAFHKIYYQTSNSDPNQTFTVQWDGVAGSYYGVNNPTDSCISFQVILCQSTNVIKFVYLPVRLLLTAMGLDHP